MPRPPVLTDKWSDAGGQGEQDHHRDGFDPGGNAEACHHNLAMTCQHAGNDGAGYRANELRGHGRKADLHDARRGRGESLEQVPGADHPAAMHVVNENGSRAEPGNGGGDCRPGELHPRRAKPAEYQDRIDRQIGQRAKRHHQAGECLRCHWPA